MRTAPFLRHCTELCILCIDFYLSAQGPAESYISRRAGPARRRLGIDPLFPLQNMALRICRGDVTRRGRWPLRSLIRVEDVLVHQVALLLVQLRGVWSGEPVALVVWGF